MRIYATKVFDIFSKSSPDVSHLLQKLDTDRQKKIVKIKHNEEKLRSIFAGLLLRYAFFDEGYTQNDWKNMELEYNEYGKPSIKEIKEFNYSLSHSGEWIICASDRENIGADIQEKRKWKLQMAKRFYHKEEYERLLSFDEKNKEEQTNNFYMMWAAKESCVKLIGRGIGAGISQYITDNKFECIKELNDKGISEKKYNLRIYDNIENYIIAVCSNKNEFANNIDVVDRNILMKL